MRFISTAEKLECSMNTLRIREMWTLLYLTVSSLREATMPESLISEDTIKAENSLFYFQSSLAKNRFKLRETGGGREKER